MRELLFDLSEEVVQMVLVGGGQDRVPGSTPKFRCDVSSSVVTYHNPNIATHLVRS